MEKSWLLHLSMVLLISVSLIVIWESIVSSSYTLVAQEGINQQQSQPLSIYDIFNKTENSVVQITTSTPPPTVPSPDRQEENMTALGSGFVYDNNGHIVTNNHVVANANIVDITFIDGKRFTANVTGSDAYSDLAVLKIVENFTQDELPPPLTLGNSSDLKVGDQVVAIGNPFGLEGSITTGIVSQTGRLLPLEETGFSVPNAIQTDALINPGNSGGPLLNMEAEVIGINTAGIFPGSIGFAVPSNAVNRIVPILIDTGNYTHPWLGMTGGSVTSDVAQREGLDRNFNGIIVDTIVKNSPADKAGINGSITNQYGERLGGDVITAVDGNTVIRMEDLISYLETHKSVGQNMTLTIYEDGKTIDKIVTIGQRPHPTPYPTVAPQPSP
ncbi:MAG TPA: trypsin-like peptidase domain-containing protein [Nitrososphaeraceae archaeon]|nr:trypsin-like peptidase domain-containing protein [Nitrososphaeraceae archaeon]